MARFVTTEDDFLQRIENTEILVADRDEWAYYVNKPLAM